MTPRLPPYAAALLLIATPLAAQTSGKPNVDAAFGNTVLSTYPDGRQARLWLKADGSYTAKGRRGSPSSGVWSLNGARICLKQRKPFAAPITYCTAAPSGGIGTSWKAKAVTGEPISVKLVKGIVER